MRAFIRTATAAAAALAVATAAAAQHAPAAPGLLVSLERGAHPPLHALALAAAQQGRRARSDDPRGGAEVVERFSRTIRLGRNGTFDLSNVAGAIVVTGGGGDEVRLEAVKRARHRDEAEARARLQEIRIEVRETAGRVEVRTEHPGPRRGPFVAVDYTVSLPQDADVTLKSVSGDVRVTNVRGELRAQTVSGDIVAGAPRRLAALRSVSGNVEITDAEADSPVTVTTVSGDVRIRKLRARGIDMRTVSGEIQLDDIDSDRAHVRTVSGNVRFSGSLARNGRYEMNSHSGGIRLAVAAGGFDVEASTLSGDVRSDYALTLRGTSPEGTARGGRRMRRGQAVRGSFGDGGAMLFLRSFSGDIVITKR